MSVRRGTDVLGLLSGQLPGEGSEAGRDTSVPALLPVGGATDLAVLVALDGAGSTVESVVLQTGLETGQVLAVLMAMVLDGRVAQRPGGRFFRTGSPEARPLR